MIRLLIILLALILAIGAGLFGLVHFKLIPDFTGMIAPAEPGAEAPATPEPAPRTPDPVMIDMPGFLVPVIRDGQVARNMFLVFRLQVDPDKASTVAYYADQLKDVYRRVLYDVVPEQLETRPTLDLPRLKARLLQVTERVVGKDVVKDVVVVSAFER